MDQEWPQEIWLVRQGYSAGNVERDTITLGHARENIVHSRFSTLH